MNKLIRHNLIDEQRENLICHLLSDKWIGWKRGGFRGVKRGAA
jgi:hypothetical protein